MAVELRGRTRARVARSTRLAGPGPHGREAESVTVGQRNRKWRGLRVSERCLEFTRVMVHGRFEGWGRAQALGRDRHGGQRKSGEEGFCEGAPVGWEPEAAA